MSAYNVFENNIESNMMEIIGAYLTTQGFVSAAVVRGEDATVETLPRVIVHCTEGEEVVYQSSNYRVKLNATVKCDLDSGSPIQSAVLFGTVFDVFQMDDLIAQLNAFSNVLIKGLVLLDHNVEDVGDRMWSKTVSMDVFGYALP